MSLLAKVASAFGIEASFRDAAGVVRATSPDTQRALLALMGIEAQSEADLRAALAQRRTANRTPPVVTVRAGEDAFVSLAPAPADQDWRLVLEDGSTLEGKLPAGERQLLLPAPLPPGYHRLTIERKGGGPGSVLLVASPERCLLPEDLGVERSFGLGVQLYGLRGEQDLGSGDFGDLAGLATRAGAEGADFLALNPLHALFFAAPGQRSPYAPSSRRFLNWLLIAPQQLPELQGDPVLAEALAEARHDDPALVDYPRMAARRRQLLELAFSRFKAAELGNPPDRRGQAFLDFRAAGGEPLERHATFEALHEAVLAQDKGGWAWWEWPEGWRDPNGSDVRTFAVSNADRITFFIWLQWLADTQLEAAQAACRAAGMRIGLYRDLAVGVDPAGSLTWSFPQVAVRGATVGAPPDLFNPLGQNWGIAPLAPTALAEAGFAPWIGDMRGNMRHAGALRIDHVMGLRRLYWIPQGASPADGAYVRYPFATMTAILALESHRHGALVVGEDLGTVPAGFRPALQAAGILSCRVLYFERRPDAAFHPPERYPAAAVASISTHDLPTLNGWLTGHDLGWRERLDLYPDAEAVAGAREQRSDEQDRLFRALRRAGLLAKGRPDYDALSLAAHRFLARTPSALLLLQLEDLEAAVEQANLPGTIDEHPNWRRRTKAVLAELLESPLARALLQALKEERPRG